MAFTGVWIINRVLSHAGLAHLNSNAPANSDA
jgi:hypothetical protein